MLATAPRLEQVTAADGYRFMVRVWKANRPLARIVCLHGIISHGGWYAGSCRYLAGAGFEVHFLERRGSGLNLVARGDVDRYEACLTDVEDYLARLTPALPRILLGISWGGKLAIAIARHRPGLVDGLALICPGLFARRGVGPVKFLGLRVARWLGIGDRKAGIPLGDPRLFTDSPDAQDFVATDPLALRSVTIRAALADAELTRYARRAARQINVPTLVVLAGRDRIIDNAAVRRFAAQIEGETRIHEYPEAGHTIEFEVDPLPYYQDLVRWARSVATVQQPEPTAIVK